jgi:hypothetical protein
LFLVLLYRRLRYGYAFRRIPLTQGFFAIVDPADYDDLAKYNWRICKSKGKHTLYAERSVRKTNGKFSRILMHRQLIPDVPAGLVIDHINADGLDNRHANLRLATVAQNAANSRPRKSRAGLKGVTFAKGKNRWRASIVANGSRIHLGYFRDPRDAAKAYDAAAKKYFGEFAYLNLSQDIRLEPVRRNLGEGRTTPPECIIKISRD